MLSTHLISVEDGGQIALDWSEPTQLRGRRVAVFVHGFASNRRGEKATFFAEQFNSVGWHFLSMDMRGHGDSSGGMEGLTLSSCIADLSTALDWLPEDFPPPLLIASSMGGAVAAWVHLLNPGRVGAIACIAPSFSFPHQLKSDLAMEELEAWRNSGLRRIQNDWLDVQVGYGLMEDAEGYDPGRLSAGYNASTLIFHGMQDDAVPWQASLRFVEASPCTTLDLLLIKAGDHRLTAYKAYMFETMLAWVNCLERRA